MSKNVILSADSTCDLGPELTARYNVSNSPLHILLEGKQYIDGVDIHPDDLYTAWRERRALPKTSAVNPEQFYTYFKKWTDEGHKVIHLSIGSALSGSYQNALIAAQELPDQVFVINSQNLSTGFGLLVLEAADRIGKGLDPAQIQEEVAALAPYVRASFIVDTLEFLHAGGRCSALAHLSANLLQLKPCIEVDGANGGAMSVGKKYRGASKKVLTQYVCDKLEDRSDLKLDRVFITHSGIGEDIIGLVRDTIQQTAGFREVHVTRAGGTISSHCGPNTLGVLFMTK